VPVLLEELGDADRLLFFASSTAMGESAGFAPASVSALAGVIVQ